MGTEVDEPIRVGNSFPINLDISLGSISHYERFREVDFQAGLLALFCQLISHFLDLLRTGCKQYDVIRKTKLKLCNFDLAVAGPVYYMMKGEILPTRYLSPETLAIFLFLHASDTFAFGNLLYELFSNGQMPYENLTSAEARQKILEGEMNDLEETCAPPALRQFIQDNLWAYEMKTRSRMNEVVVFLKKTYRAFKKEQGGPKTNTETEETASKDEPRLPKKGKLRRRTPANRQEIMEELFPIMEESANNE